MKFFDPLFWRTVLYSFLEGLLNLLCIMAR